ncbi:MAG: hypothetical protein EA345_02075 [Halomonas sp.]|nr:MAG: hypothetical protein EA345_02075 [Halomonas sp.]
MALPLVGLALVGLGNNKLLSKLCAKTKKHLFSRQLHTVKRIVHLLLETSTKTKRSDSTIMVHKIHYWFLWISKKKLTQLLATPHK